jgi:predicted transcriptional regulator of viral defense system
LLSTDFQSQIIQLFQKHNGIVSAADLRNSGFSLFQFYPLLKQGSIVRVHHGYYKWIESEMTENDDLVIISRIIPNGIICLLSALAYYEMVTTIPREIQIALKRGATKPKRPTYPPVRYFYYALDSFLEGMEEITIQGEEVRIYNIERTICDCIKFRSKIGLEIMKEALKNYLNRPTRNITRLEIYAKKLRVSSILQQYLEILL